MGKSKHFGARNRTPAPAGEGGGEGVVRPTNPKERKVRKKAKQRKK